MLTNNTFEVYNKLSDEVPVNFICFDWSEFKVNSKESGTLIEISNDSLELLFQAETPRKAEQWREQIDLTIQKWSGIKSHRWFIKRYYKVPHLTLG